MRALVFLTILVSLSLTACNRTVAADQLGKTCARRLGDRTSLSSNQIGKFCTCFLDASLKKVPAETLAKEFETGSSDVFKGALQAEFNQCKSAISQ